MGVTFAVRGPLDQPHVVRIRAEREGATTIRDLVQGDVNAVIRLLPRISQPILTTADAGKLEPADLIEFARVIGDFFVPKAERESLSA